MHRRPPARTRRSVAWAFVVVCAVAGVLLWLLWVLPVATSVARATPASFGRGIDLPEDAAAGVWASGPAALLGLVECDARTAENEALAVTRTPSPGWDDTLTWMTPRAGFVPVFTVAPDPEGGESAGVDSDASPAAATITCTAVADAYDGSFLVAADVSGGGGVGLGRTGTADYPLGTVFAVGAVVLPPLAFVLSALLVGDAIARRTRPPRAVH